MGFLLIRFLDFLISKVALSYYKTFYRISSLEYPKIQNNNAVIIETVVILLDLTRWNI